MPNNFEPWERSNPLPLIFIFALLGFFLLALLYYANSHYPAANFSQQEVADKYQPRQLDTQAADDAPSIVTQGSSSVWGCASCHGTLGQGSGQTPALAGLTASYLEKQLADFANNERENASMHYVAKHLTPEEAEAAINYFARLERQVEVITPLGGNPEAGKKLAEEGKPEAGVPPCSSCHSAATAAVFPNLSGQRPSYIFSQLEAFKGGQRTNDEVMINNAKGLTSQEMLNLTEYFHQLEN